jgi:hypothetical protein
MGKNSDSKDERWHRDADNDRLVQKVLRVMGRHGLIGPYEHLIVLPMIINRSPKLATILKMEIL